MAQDPNNNLAGPIVFEEAIIEHNAMIREKNDGTRIDDTKVVEYVENNKEEIFRLQSVFFAELREASKK